MLLHTFTKKNKRKYCWQWFFIIRSTKCRIFFFANPLFVAVEFHLRRHLALEIVISLVGCFDVSQSRVQLVVQGRRKREGHRGLRRGAITSKTSKIVVLPWLCKIEHGGGIGGVPPCYGSLTTKMKSSAIIGGAPVLCKQTTELTTACFGMPSLVVEFSTQR